MTSKTIETELDLRKAAIRAIALLDVAIAGTVFTKPGAGRVVVNVAKAQAVLDGLRAALSRAPGALTDVFERPFDDDDDPRLRVARVLTRREAEAVLEHAGDLVAALSPLSTGGEKEGGHFDADLSRASSSQTPLSDGECGICPPHHDLLCGSACPCLLPDRHDGPHVCDTRDGRLAWQSDDDCDCCDVTDPDRCITWSELAEQGEAVAWRFKSADGTWVATTDKEVADRWSFPSRPAQPLYLHPSPETGKISRADIEAALGRKLAEVGGAFLSTPEIVDALLSLSKLNIDEGLLGEGDRGSARAGSGAAGPSDCAEGDARLSDGEGQ